MLGSVKLQGEAVGSNKKFTPRYEFHEEESIKFSSLAVLPIVSQSKANNTEREINAFFLPMLHRIAGKLKNAFKDAEYNENRIFHRWKILRRSTDTKRNRDKKILIDSAFFLMIDDSWKGSNLNPISALAPFPTDVVSKVST